MTTSTHEAVVLRGRGVHTGISSSVEVRRRDDEGGLRFFWPGSMESILPVDLISFRREARRSTVLKSASGQSIRTPEHLLAAALFFAEQPLDVVCDAAELPGLDGSAAPFYEAFSGIAEPATWREYDSELRWEYEGPEGSIRTIPFDSFSLEYEWRAERFSLFVSDIAIQEILPARTFIHYRKWIAVKRDADLLAGVDAGSGLLLADSPEEFASAREKHPEFEGQSFPLLHPARFRMKQEVVKHKILDLLGDLALLDLSLPKLRLEIRDGGHALNHLLLEQLQHERRERKLF
ncbi:MAG TPA: hypothetical protein DCQ83_00725 [Fibrobacteres bacterium]|jgi:UDP-3-O-acyl-N-acetylglucosamine deacetylase|nr:hypothetical protein [Fibrobacterota bacterium]